VKKSARSDFASCARHPICRKWGWPSGCTAARTGCHELNTAISSVQIELLNRKRWVTRVKLSNAMFDYIEIFHHHHQRRHSQLDYASPIEFE